MPVADPESALFAVPQTSLDMRRAGAGAALPEDGDIR